MECKECNNKGLTMIDVGAPMGNGKIEGYCDCKAGEDLAHKEICFDCGCHRDETNEKIMFGKSRQGTLIYLCKPCYNTANSPHKKETKI